MATVTPPTQFNHEESQRRVHHPLGVVRRYIRRYVILEGLALTILFMTALFWIGLAFDYGMYLCNLNFLNIHGIDWMLELDDLDGTGRTSLSLRVIVLAVGVISLITLGVMKVVMRWVSEFNDRAIALVLERRFHKQLGDRLITAVELADPKLAKKYGYSQAMVDKTIQEAVMTLDTLPVAAVFNWGRLVKLWLLVGATTVGLWLVMMTLFCLGSLLTSKAVSPYGYSWRFTDAASIWAERNILMMPTYWPRNSYLEIGRFQPSKDNPNEMHVDRDRDSERGVLHVRAFEWVVADRSAPQGWRALRWDDLPRFVDQPTLDNVKISKDFPYWKMDVEELEPNLVSALFGSDTSPRSSGQIDTILAQTDVKEKIDQRGAKQQVAEWRDWQHWTVDKLGLQMKMLALRDKNYVAVTAPTSLVGLLASPSGLWADLAASAGVPDSAIDLAPLAKIFAQLEERAESPSMSRTLRKLVIPTSVAVAFRGEENTSEGTYDVVEGSNRYTLPLQPLSKDSKRYKFRVRGENYFTPPKYVALVAAPTVIGIAYDKEEPAYVYHRIEGEDQSPLRGYKHRTSVTLETPIKGSENIFDVPLGSNLAIHVRLDRELRERNSVFDKKPSIIEPGYDSFRGEIKIDSDRKGFSMYMKNLTRRHDFGVEYFDEDNIRGERRFKVVADLDYEPKLSNLSVRDVKLFNLYPPRMERMDVDQKTEKVDEKDKKKGKQPELNDVHDMPEIKAAMMITPDAVIPFECMVRDDYGLVRVGYHFKSQIADVVLTPLGPKKSATAESLADIMLRLNVGAPVSCLQYTPINPATWHFARHHTALTSDVMRIAKLNIKEFDNYREAYVPSKGFTERMMRPVTPKAELASKLREKRSVKQAEFDFKDDPGFSVAELLPEIKSTDPSKQFYHLLQISVQASDNNVETGIPYYTEKGELLYGKTEKNKNGYVSFLVVTENELLFRIAQEEDPLLQHLRESRDKVRDCVVGIDEQKAKLANPKVDMETVFIAMTDMRTGLDRTGKTLARTHKEYANILNVMLVNRIPEERISRIRNIIINRLKNIVIDAPRSIFGKAEDAFLQEHQLVEKDYDSKRTPNLEEHEKYMAEAGKHLRVLELELQQLIASMETGISLSQVEERLRLTRDGQLRETLRWATIRKKLEDDLFK